MALAVNDFERKSNLALAGGGDKLITVFHELKGIFPSGRFRNNLGLKTHRYVTT